MDLRGEGAGKLGIGLRKEGRSEGSVGMKQSKREGGTRILLPCTSTSSFSSCFHHTSHRPPIPPPTHLSHHPPTYPTTHPPTHLIQLDGRIVTETLFRMDDAEQFSSELLKVMLRLWADEGIQQCFARSNEFQLNDSAK